MPTKDNVIQVKSHADIRKALAIAVVERCQMLELAPKSCYIAAKHSFMAASKLANIQDNSELSTYLREAYSEITEHGYKIVPRWAAMTHVPKNNCDEREAA